MVLKMGFSLFTPTGEELFDNKIPKSSRVLRYHDWHRGLDLSNAHQLIIVEPL